MGSAHPPGDPNRRHGQQDQGEPGEHRHVQGLQIPEPAGRHIPIGLLDAVCGQALGQALGDKKGIRRFGDAFIPMDETLTHAAVDVSGRPYCVHTGEPDHLRHFTIAGSSAPYHTVVNRHVFESLAMNARIALHVRTIYGRDPHHITEAQYKAVARALRHAVEFDPRVTGVPSTKGTL